MNVLQENDVVTSIDLARNEIGVDGVKAIAEALNVRFAFCFCEVQAVVMV